MNPEKDDLMHHGNSPESIEAHASIADIKETIRRAVVRFAIKRGKEGITADELAEAWGCSHNHVAPRITELKALGRLVPTNNRRTTRSGRNARVLVVPEASTQ